MLPDSQAELRLKILTKAKSLGPSLAGLASVDALRDSPSYALYHETPYYDGYKAVEWPTEAKSVLVLALHHHPSKAELDWWSDIPGKTQGNLRLMEMARLLAQWLTRELRIGAQPLPYQLEQGGVLLKDAAVLAGLGIIGKNNLVITPEYGPRIRLRALFLDAFIEPSGPLAFDPCCDCDMPCRGVCPQGAFRSGSYSRTLCDRQMTIDYDNAGPVDDLISGFSGKDVVKYCRACELACPVPRENGYHSRS